MKRFLIFLVLVLFGLACGTKQEGVVFKASRVTSRIETSFVCRGDSLFVVGVPVEVVFSERGLDYVKFVDGTVMSVVGARYLVLPLGRCVCLVCGKDLENGWIASRIECFDEDH